MNKEEETKELIEVAQHMFVQCCNQFTAAFVAASNSGHFTPWNLANAIYGTIGSIAHQLPDSIWKEMMDVKPCGNEGCTCHLTMKQFMDSVDVVRNRAKDYFANEKGEQTHEE